MLSGGQFEQLSMFTTPREAMKLGTSDVEAGETHEDMWARKVQESKADDGPGPAPISLHDSIAQHGVQHPIHVMHEDGGKELYDGHHRIAVANTVDPDMLIPQYHNDDSTYSQYMKRRLEGRGDF